MWWKNAVFYQIYPRSFQDSNADGVGDLRGIISRLDYLNDGMGGGLGIDAIWVSPFFASPNRDFGYDVSGYDQVAPEMGNVADAEELIRQAHRRGIKVVLDLVINHCSDEHPWFKEARASRQSPKHDWFLWAEGRGKDGKRLPPPNNWKCLFTLKSGWHYNQPTGEYYLGTFTPNQPEFDWRTPEFKAEMFKAIRFWLDRGADGYRMDVCTAYLKDEALRSNPPSLNAIPNFFQRHLYDRNQKGVHAIFREIRSIAEEYSAATGSERVLIGEPHGQDPLLAASCQANGNELHLAFNFGLLRQPFKARAMEGAAREWYGALRDTTEEKTTDAAGNAEGIAAGEGIGTAVGSAGSIAAGENIGNAEGIATRIAVGNTAWPSLVLSNHDQPRAFWRYRSRFPSRLGRLKSEARARVAATMLLTLKGTPFLYQGEEIGMEGHPVPRGQVQDPLGKSLGLLSAFGRDNERRPMQWDETKNAGFSQAKPWLPLDGNYQSSGATRPGVNAEAQAEAPNSLLNFYKGLLRLRKSEPALMAGDIRFIGPYRDLLAFERFIESGDRIIVILNFSGRPRRAPAAYGEVIFGTHRNAGMSIAHGGDKSQSLSGYECLILKG
jgi:alpha-glucosidase